MGRISRLEESVHGRSRHEDDVDEVRFGVNASRTFYARVREPVDGAQWTGVVTTVAATLLERGIVDAVVCTGSEEGDPLKPVGVIARSVEEVLACRGVKPVVAPTLSILADLERLVRDAGVKRVLAVGVGCQVQALRSVQHHLGLEKLYVMGTNCVDNGRSRETLDKFLRKAVPERHEEVSNYEVCEMQTTLDAYSVNPRRMRLHMSRRSEVRRTICLAVSLYSLSLLSPPLSL